MGTIWTRKNISVGKQPASVLIVATLCWAALWSGCKKSATELPKAPPANRGTLEPRARAGEAVAQNALGELYAKGEGFPLSYTQAYTWYRAAADQGLADAEYNVATLLEVGQGVKRDEAEALRWYQKAADQGHPGAQHNLGSMYAAGRGVAQNSIEAAKWFRLSAQGGEALAQYNIGQRYELGRGVEKDLVEAYKWHSLAARQGIPDAAAARDRIKRQLSGSQLAEAEKHIKEFKPRMKRD